MTSNDPNSQVALGTVYLTKRDIMSLLDVSLPTINNWIRDGLLTPIKIGNGRKCYFEKDAILPSRKYNKRKEVVNAK